MADSLTLLHPNGRQDVSAIFDGEQARIPADSVRDILGWELKPEGLCQPGGVCVPVADRESLADDRGIDLALFAEALGVPVAIDAAAGAAAIGTSHVDRSAQLETLEAPDFTLPDLSGAMHSLSDHRGKKVLLIAYASW